MLDTHKLNRRHKAVLFVTLLGVGIALIGGAGEGGAGIAFMGAALAWAIGSNSRIVHGAFVVAGLLLFCGGVTWAWWNYRSHVRQYTEKVTQFEKRVPFFSTCYPLLPRPKSVPEPVDPYAEPFAKYGGFGDCESSPAAPPRDLQMTSPDLAKLIKVYYPVYEGIPDVQLVSKFVEKYPAWKSAIVDTAPHSSHAKWFEDAIAENVNPEEVPTNEEPGDPPRFSWADTEFFGLAALPLLAIGLGLIFGVRPTPHPGPPTAK